jgi:hypothetical protein
VKRTEASTTTLDDLKMYFKHGGETPVKRRGEVWRTRAREGGGLHAESSVYSVDLAPGGTVFHVEVSAYDDPSDADAQVTDSPTEFLVDFLKTGTAGDSVFEKMASAMRRASSFGPSEVSGILRLIAAETESGKLTKRQAVLAIRRASVLPTAGLAEARHAKESEDIATLEKEMEAKGWKVKASEDESRGLPVLTADISGVYGARISVDHVSWSYKFSLVMDPSVKVEGVTDDPIEEFESFYKDPSTKDARKSAEARAAEERLDHEDDVTVPPPRRS